MNLVQNRTLHPHLRDEEALVVENAIRLAIDSIVNVLYGVNSARTHEYQRMVGDRDKEIQRLECRLREIERDLQVLRRQGCTCGLLRKPRSHAGAQSCSDRGIREQIGLEPSCSDAEVTAGQPECEMSISLGVFARPPSHVSSQSHESAFPSSPSRVGLDQTCTSHSSEASGVSRNFPRSPSSLVVKEEPCDTDAVTIKWEMSEERFGENQESRGSPCQDKEGPSVKKKQDNGDTKKLRERPQAEPSRRQITEAEHLRNKKKSVPMSELPEEAQRLKRAAWRAASRRYYARKIARQQADPSRPVPFSHIAASQYSQPISFVDKRRRTLISELPEESQMLQREAWRAASRRYYARKIARPRTDPTQFGHLLPNKEPFVERRGPNSGGSHTNNGGIMCS
ncbi:hypothetical protein EXN66_Car007964 [Channa argus]|uniref:Uncharacterized protein n=1 Tax=Channa argus TaxID=215402 RepID=A0A6G1PQN1_CHAAH|nr:hypothetical protein EXN66_Car007964 [Channa argus]KAK2909856.1 hypothetical protein Q8A73_007571 [Channa argus]